MAVRHAHELLRDMKENGNVQVLIEINYLMHVWLIRDKEIIDQQGKSYYFIIFISSPGPKVQVNYCHHLASVVCRL